MIHSLGGGTGSGFGTYILGLLEEYYADVFRCNLFIFRFTTSIFPNNDDHVVTSPYNSMLSLNEVKFYKILFILHKMIKYYSVIKIKKGCKTC